MQTGPRAKKRRLLPSWWPAAKVLALAAGLWLILVAAALVSRSPWPMDETRLLATAWDTWRVHGLVPRLNDAVLASPPLFTWLTQIGWKLFGVVEWWPRLLPAFFGLANLALVALIARRLWPASAQVAYHAPLVLVGTAGFALMLTVTLPEMLGLFAVLLSLWALTIMWRARDLRAWLLLALAQTVGVLATGPLMLVYVTPLALAAPVWVGQAPALNWRYWYADVFKSAFVALAVHAAWIAAAAHAGAGNPIDLLTASFAPAALDLFARTQPLWWYAAIVPLVMLPWFIWPVLWLRLWHIRREPLNSGFVFCLVWGVLPLIALSLFDVKQPQYLLPLVPAAALATAWLLFEEKLISVAEERAIAGLMAPVVVIGAVLAVLPKVPPTELVPDFLRDLSPLVGVGVMVVGFALGWLPHRPVRERARDMAIATVALAVFVLLGAATQFDRFYAVGDVAQYLGEAGRAGRPLAHVGRYAGQYDFAGRLPRPLEVIAPEQVAAWAGSHPDGLIIADSAQWQPASAPGAPPAFRGTWRGGTVVVWPANAVEKVP